MVYRFSLNDENYRINGQRHEGKREAKVQFSWGGGGGGGGGGRNDEKLRKPSIYRKFIDFLISVLRYEIKIVHL